MIFKFTQLFSISVVLFFSAIRVCKAQLFYTETPAAIHVYTENQKAFLSLPLTTPFVEAAVIEQKIYDKLGSFKKSQKRVFKKTRKIQEFQINQNKQSISIKGVAKGLNFKTEFELLIKQNDNDIQFSLSTSDLSVNEITLRIASTANEQIFGLGTQFSHVNFKGKKVDMLVEENGIGRGDKTSTTLAKIVGAAGNEYTTYAPVPFFHTTENRAFMIENTEVSHLDFSQSNLISVSVPSNKIHGYIWQAENPKELLTLYTNKTGRMPMLPKWVYDGAILGLQGGKTRVEEIINKSLQAGIPVSAIWIQDWVGKRQTSIGSRLQWDWKANETSYPDFKQWCDSLMREGIRVLGYINPYMVEGGNSAIHALANNYVVKNSKGKPYKFKAGGFNAYMIDFTNSEAYNWYQSIIENEMLGVGLSGWMADFGEWLPFDAQVHSGISASAYHNQYPVDWSKLNREVIDKLSRSDVFIFNRSGFTNSAKYATTFWVGDQLANFGMNDGFPSAICALVSSGMSGFTINHSDIGGYTAINLGPFKFLRDNEILSKWMEMEAFTPIFRTHEGLMPEKMSQFYDSEENLSYFAEMATINRSLKPLFLKFNKEASEFGWPIIRHPYLEFPEDTNTYNIKYQFMVGDTLMVMPNINKGQSTISGYLPKGKWIDFFTNEEFEGGNFYEFESYRSKPVAFYRHPTQNCYK